MDEITIDEFFKIDLRVAKVIEVIEVEEADKLILNNNQNHSKTQNVSKQKDKEKSAAKSKKISKK